MSSTDAEKQSDEASISVSGEALSEEPWFQGNQCAFCLVKDEDSEVDLMRCGACKQTFYCSREHQRSDWPAHKLLCKKLCEGSVDKARSSLALRHCECNNHALADLSAYVHALNNMAGRHKIDLMISEDEEENTKFDTGDFSWYEIAENEVLANGLQLQKGCMRRREMGPLGNGYLVRGPIRVGTLVKKEEDGSTSENVVALQMTGSGSFEWKVPKDCTLRVNEHLVLESGAGVDGFCVLHGPLTYHGVQVDKSGGVHYSGSYFAFEADEPGEPARYTEHCIVRTLHEREAKNASS